MAKGSKSRRNTRTEAKKKKIAEQPAKTARNKIRKMLKHLRSHPNDLQTKGKV